MAGKNLANSRTSDNSSVVDSPMLVIENGKPVVSSLTIASHFGKQHKDVLRKIESLEIPDDFGRRNFTPSSYVNGQNKEQPAYNLTRDGFSLLVMGFTGKKATLWKVRYIEAFNMMEQELSKKVEPEHQAIAEDAELLSLPTSLSFHGVTLDVIYDGGTPWLRSTQVAQAIDMGSLGGASSLYSRNKDEFTPEMSKVLNLKTCGNPARPTRIFSPRGCHMIGVLARTARAKEFRTWAINNLEGKSAASAPQQALPEREQPSPEPQEHFAIDALATCADNSCEAKECFKTAKFALLRGLYSAAKNERKALYSAYDAVIEAEQSMLAKEVNHV